MKLFGKDLTKEVAIVAEIGVNHEGDPEAARRLIRLAAEAGADAVKFQTYTPERFASADDPARLERVGRFGLSTDTHWTLKCEADEAGIVFFSTAVTEDVVPLLAELAPVIKIASGDLDFEPVIRAAAGTGKPVIISTGLGTLDEVDQAVDWVRDEVGAAALAERLILMQCVSAYPTPIEEAGVAAVPLMRERYGVTVGYSNHIIGPEACHAAIVLGAPLLEVHFTDQKGGREFRDHALSFEPSDLRNLVEQAPRIRACLGAPEKIRMPSEAGNLEIVRKGVVAARDIPGGTVLARDDLMFARPATEFPANQVDRLVGATLAIPLKRGELVRRDAVSMPERR